MALIQPTFNDYQLSSQQIDNRQYSAAIATLDPSGPITASGTSANSINTGAFDEAVFYIDVTAVSGTTPSDVIKVQSSPDGSAWFDTADTVTVSAVGRAIIKSTNLGAYVRLSHTVTGTAPSLTMSTQVAIKSLG